MPIPLDQVKRDGSQRTRRALSLRVALGFGGGWLTASGAAIALWPVSVGAMLGLFAVGSGIGFWIAARAVSAWVARCDREFEALEPIVDAAIDGRFERRLPVDVDRDFHRVANAVNRLSAALQSEREGEVRDRRERDAILTGMAAGLIAVDADQRVMIINRIARELIGSSVGEPRGRPIWEVSRIPELNEAISECLTSGVRVVREFRGGRVTGARVLRFIASSIRSEADVVEGCVLLIEDLSELRRLEAVRRDFVANVSHELKTPLTSVIGFIETVFDDPEMPATTRTRFLGKALDGAGRLAAIVGDLLSLARLESEEGKLQPSSFDLLGLVAECAAQRSVAAAQAQVRVDTRSPQEPLVVSADRESLGLALSNLLDNAVKYSPAGSRVEIACGVLTESTPEKVWIEVADQGPGIPPAERERIFERFYRVDRDRSRQLGGTGLGLSIVRNVVNLHGGDVSVTSEMGAGCVFRCVILREAVG